MEDGGYYSAISSTPIHQNTNNSWEDVYEEFIDEPQCTNDVENILSNVESSSNTNITTDAEVEDNSIFCKSNTVVETDGEFDIDLFDEDYSLLFIKPNFVDTYSSENRIITKVLCNFSATVLYDDCYLKIYEEKTNWEDEIGNDGLVSYNIGNLYDLSLLEKTVISENTVQQSIDITSSFVKWERNSMDNHGLCIKIESDTGEIIISNIYFSIYYKDANYDNLNYTYHTLDMGKAGVLSINDISNAYVINESLCGIDSNFPVNISRIISSVSPDLSSHGNIGGKINYGVSLTYIGNVIVWTTPNGSNIRFVETEETTSDGYTIWEQVTDNALNCATLYINSNTNLIIDNTDFSDCYIEDTTYCYYFNTSGTISSIVSGTKSINFNYGAYGIMSIINSDGTSFIFSYGTYKIRTTTYHYLNEIKAFTPEQTEIANLNITVNTTYNAITKKITSTTTFHDGSEISYIFDNTGLLEKVICQDASEVFIEYKSKENPYIVSYEQKNGNDIIKSILIESNDIYYRIFTNEDSYTEKYYFDSNYRLLTYQDSKTKNISCMSYDQEGNIYSYATLEKDSILSNHNFSVNPSQDVTNKWSISNLSFFTYQDSSPHAKLASSDASVKVEQNISYQVNERPEAGETLVFGITGKLNNTYPVSSDDHYVGVVLKAYYTDRTSETFSLEFDTSLHNNNQVLLKAIDLKKECQKLSYSINVKNQEGYLLVEDAILFFADEAMVFPPNIETSSVYSTILDNDGKITEERITKTISSDVLSLVQSYSYDEESNIQSITDFDGITKYYKYDKNSNKLIESGNSIDINGNIINPNTFVYGTSNLLNEVSSVISSTVNNPETITSKYEYNSNEKISSVCLNDSKYDFNYSAEGDLLSVSLSNLDDTNSNINLQTYEYTSNNNIGSINYANGSSVIFKYNNNGQITKIKYFDASEQNGEVVLPVIEFEYSYNQDNISEVICTKNHFQTSKVKIKFTNDSYKLYNLTSVNGPETSTLIYDSSKEGNIQTQKYYNPDRNEYEQFNTTYSSNNYYNVNITGSKQLLWGNSTNSFDININVSKDDFGRNTSKVFTGIQTSSAGNIDNVNIENEFSYELLDQGITSNLISQKTTNIIANNNTMSSKTKKYIYDNNGNLHFVFNVNDNNDYSLEEYYEYDSLNQLIYSFINTGSSSKKSYERYYYDKYGNLVEKISYDTKPEITVENTNDPNVIELISDVFYSTNIPESCIDFGILKDVCISMDYNNYKKTTYSYDSIYHNRMISYKESEFAKIYENDEESNNSLALQETVLVDTFNISYDLNGNPNQYIGYDSSGNLIKANLKWQCNNLIEFEKLDNNGNISNIFTYSYDQNGYRIEKCKYYIDNNNEKVLSNKIQYVWENGALQSLIFTGDIQKFRSNVPIDNSKISYSKILYDSDGNPSGYITPSGVMYGFVEDVKGNITRLVRSDGDETVKISYDSFGNIKFDNPPKLSDCNNNVNLWLQVYNAYLLTAQFNPCTYKGYLLDYESGMYYSKSQCYSPTWNRYISTENDYSKLQTPTYKALDTNLYLFCNNNPISNNDFYSSWSTNVHGFEWFDNGFSVDISKAFLSRPICSIYAAQIIKNYGNTNYMYGSNMYNMGVERIASNLFSVAVGYYTPSTINKVNANWGVGWLNDINKFDKRIYVKSNEDKKIIDNYKYIWCSAPTIRNYAWSNGIFITL